MDINNLTTEQLLDNTLYEYLISIPDEVERSHSIAICKAFARKKKMTQDFNSLLKAHEAQSRNALGREYKSNHTEFSDSPLVNERPIVLDCGSWTANDSGVFRVQSDSKGKQQIKYACSHPILPTAILKNIDLGLERLQISYRTRNGWDDLVCKRSVAANQNKIIDLADDGVSVTNKTSKELMEYIADCVDRNLTSLPYYKSIGRMGWVEKDFMPYNKDIKFDGDRENAYLYKCLTASGDYHGWVKYVNKLRKNKMVRLQMAASFASPLIEKLDTLPFVLHYWGQSGTGKTVGMMVAASVWGKPTIGRFVRTMDSTQNAMMNIAGFLNSIPFFGDELQLIKDKWGNYDKLIMKCTEGADRGRMHYDKLLPTKTWRCAFVFCGEENIVRKDSGGGVFNRTIEVEVNKPIIENGNEVVNFITDNYGYAGQYYINAIKEELIKGNVHLVYNEAFKRIMQNCLTSEKQAMAGALLLTGDYFAEKHIFRGDDEVCLTCADIKPFLFSPDEIDVAARAYDWLQDWIATNKIRFDNSEDNRGEIWGKIVDLDKDGKPCNNSRSVASSQARINKTVLEKHMREMGIEFSAVCKRWANSKLLTQDSQGRFYHNTNVYGVKANYVFLKIDRSVDVEPIKQEHEEKLF